MSGGDPKPNGRTRHRPAQRKETRLAAQGRHLRPYRRSCGRRRFKPGQIAKRLKTSPAVIYSRAHAAGCAPGNFPWQDNYAKQRRKTLERLCQRIRVLANMRLTARAVAKRIRHSPGYVQDLNRRFDLGLPKRLRKPA